MIKIEISRFQNYCREQLNLGENTLRAYNQDLATFLHFLSFRQTDPEVTGDLLLQYRVFLRAEIQSSPATIRRRFVTLKSYFKWFEQEPDGEANPFAGLHLDLKVPRRLPRPVDRPTLAMLFKSSKHMVQLDPEHAAARAPTSDQVTGLVSRLLVVTGMRIGEITTLKLRDVSSACTKIRVRGKGNRERTVYVTNEQLLIDFRKYWESRSRNDVPSAFLFLNSRGSRLTEPAFRKRLRALSQMLMISPYVTPHQFRHSAATLLIEEGVDIRMVQRLLGHASISTTELYTKVSDTSLIAAIERADTLAQVDS